MNRPDTVYDGVHPNPTITTYDAMFAVSVKDPRRQVYGFQHNALGWETSRKAPAGDSSVSTYTANGQLATFTNRRGKLLTYRYDALDRLLAKHDPVAADSATYSYSVGVNNIQRVATNALETDTYYGDSTGWTDSVKTYVPATRTKPTPNIYKQADLGQLDSVGDRQLTHVHVGESADEVGHNHRFARQYVRQRQRDPARITTASTHAGQLDLPE